MTANDRLELTDVGIAAAGRRPGMTKYGSAATGVRPGIAGNNPNDDNSRQRVYAPKLPDVYVTVTGVCPGITVRNPVNLGLAAITRTLDVEAVDRRTPRTPIWVRQMRTLRKHRPATGHGRGGREDRASGIVLRVNRNGVRTPQ